MQLGRPTVSNPTADLSDLRLEVEQYEDGTASLRVHLIFGTAEIPIDEKTFEAFAKQATLRVRCEGVEIDPESRFGQRLRAQSEKSTKTTSSDVSSQAHIEAGASGGVDVRAPSSATGSINLAAGVSRKSEAKASTTTTVETETLRVEALGGDRWLITEIENGEPLRGTYLGSEALCKLRTVGKANRQRVEVSIEIRQKDLEFDPIPGRLTGALFGGANREKLLKILMAKSLHEKIGDGEPFKGVIVMSTAICDRDEE